MIDQPTQPLYPPELAKNTGAVDYADCAAVSAMVTVMRDVLEELAPRMQITVCDHADLAGEQWFQDAVVHRWRDSSRLEPAEWTVTDRSDATEA
ncbi:hypothetical protein CH289_04580 [Rhodococcus sp. RS1C4]|nr:hypothetical protein CH289_04580 [Rhodococcus sp. RS1C4]